jgi:chloramphenicol-sensitive protein RarD
LDFPLPTLVSHRLTKFTKAEAGVLFAIGSYLWWAFATPLYFKAFKEVPVVELVIWRVMSGLPLLLMLLFFRGTLASCYKSLRTRKTLLLLMASSFLISVNWVVFVISVVEDQLIASSLGYYINPIVTVAIGYLILGERLRKLQIVAVCIALTAIVYLTIDLGSLPWISIVLPATFSLYGLLRKVMGVGSIEGLAVEMTFALPLCLILQWWLVSSNQSAIGDGNFFILGGLLLGGLVTIVPLLLFASGARRLKLATIGILQYIAPSGQLLLATFIFHEEFGRTQAIVFGLIWLAVVLYSVDAWRSRTMTAEPGLD